MKGVTYVLPRECHAHKPFLVPLGLDASLGVRSHQPVKACTLLHPHGVKFALQPIDLPRDHAVLIPCGSVTTHLRLEGGVTKVTHRCIHFSPVVILGVEVLRVFGLVVGLLPRISVGGGLYFGDECRATRDIFPYA